MAKEIAKLLRTEMAADVTALPMLAKLLQSYGRKGDKMLAHITPEEAQRLEEEGGSGTINPHTGLPEYYDGEDYFGYAPEAPTEAQTYGAGEAGGGFEPATTPSTSYEGSMDFGPVGTPSGGFVPDYGITPTSVSVPQAVQAGMTPPVLPAVAPADQLQKAIAEAEAPPPEEKGFLDKLGLTKEQALRLGLGGVSALATGLVGQRGIRQAQQAREDVAALGRPYQETGKRLQEQALRGELTPAGQQQVQAAQAQLAQGAERRGGVGAQQAATQIAAFRQNLLDQQYNYGLKVAQIGDSYAAQAIRTGLTQDQEMARMMANLASTVGNVYGVMPPQSPARG
jgi:hypothetical protein